MISFVLWFALLALLCMFTRGGLRAGLVALYLILSALVVLS